MDKITNGTPVEDLDWKVITKINVLCDQESDWIKNVKFGLFPKIPADKTLNLFPDIKKYIGAKNIKIDP